MFRDEPGLQHAFGLRTAGGLSLTDCLQVHVFELSKYAVPSDNRVITNPVDQWLYFFRRAADCTAEELAARLPDPVFAEATGVLQMIVRNPEERQLYDDRLKAERDEWARTEQAKLDGKLEERLRVVKVLRDIVGESVPSDLELAGLSLDQLGQLETTYQQQLRDRT